MLLRRVGRGYKFGGREVSFRAGANKSVMHSRNAPCPSCRPFWAWGAVTPDCQWHPLGATNKGSLARCAGTIWQMDDHRQLLPSLDRLGDCEVNNHFELATSSSGTLMMGSVLFEGMTPHQPNQRTHVPGDSGRLTGKGDLTVARLGKH